MSAQLKQLNGGQIVGKPHTMDQITEILLNSLPEMLGGLSVVAILTVLSIIRNRIRTRISSNNLIVGRSTTDLNAVKQSLDNLTTKIEKLRDNDDHALVLVGATYLDFFLRPILTERLTDIEWSNLDPIEVDLGGSSLLVGRYLWEIYEKKSHLFSVKGAADNNLNTLFDAMIENEDWLLNRLQVGKPNSKSPITVHLIQNENRFMTKLTHRGAAASMDWSDIDNELGEVLRDGGILFISGFMKTNLNYGFKKTLAQVHTNTLICLEHGNIVKNYDNPQSVYSILEAFSLGLVDVYLCNLTEILTLASYTGFKSRKPNKRNVVTLLEKVTKSVSLPPITIVRGSDSPTKVQAFIIIENSVISIVNPENKIVRNTVVHPRCAFNATVLYEMIYGERFSLVRDLAVHATQKAATVWIKYD